MEYSIIIIGGGLTGASVAYHLYSLKDFKGKVILLEAGVIGEGVSSIEKSNSFESLRSGSNVFKDPKRIKIITTNFASTALEFLRHHGMSGISLYNKIATMGSDTQFKLAKLYLNNGYNVFTDYNTIPDEIGFIQLGTVMLCFERDLEDFKVEYDLLKKGGFECEWWDTEKVQNMHGTTSGFHAGIYFPKQAIVDSSGYAKKLVDSAKKNGLEVRENTRVINVIENHNDNKMVKVVFDNQEVIYGSKIVISTGGLTVDKNLSGIIKPCYSYASALKTNIDYNQLSKTEGNIEKMKNSPNFYTFGFTHDWCMTQGYLRISGEDHMSALKDPKKNERCNNISSWAYDRYPLLKQNVNLPESNYINGVYSETPDMIPLLGSISNESKIFYLVGCNAWGQAILSAGSYLMPGLLGERSLTKEEEEMVNFLSIRRFNFNKKLRAKF